MGTAASINRGPLENESCFPMLRVRTVKLVARLRFKKNNNSNKNPLFPMQRLNKNKKKNMSSFSRLVSGLNLPTLVNDIKV